MEFPSAPSKREYLWDDQLKGFGVMATHGGVKSYIVQYRIGGRGGQTRRLTIGHHGSPWTPESARQQAADHLELVRRKIDPFDAEREKLAAKSSARAAADKERKDADRLGFGAYADTFIERCARPKQRARTLKETIGIIDRDLKPRFGAASIATIAPRQIVELIDEVHQRSRSAALKAYRTLSVIFGWAASRHDIPDNPMRNLKPPYVQPSRDRVLTDNELRRAWLAASAIGYPYGSIIQVLILTGQRLNEVAGMKWEEIDFARSTWTVPKERAKRNRPNVVPLLGRALAIVSDTPRLGEHVFTSTGRSPFSGFSKAKGRLDAAMADQGAGSRPESTPWRIHDLRRTFATNLQRLGVRLEVTEALLNHVSGSRAGIVGIYQQHDWALEKVKAIRSWDKRVALLVGTPNG